LNFREQKQAMLATFVRKHVALHFLPLCGLLVTLWATGSLMATGGDRVRISLPPPLVGNFSFSLFPGVGKPAEAGEIVVWPACGAYLEGVLGMDSAAVSALVSSSHRRISFTFAFFAGLLVLEKL
jgi:hypothetical protein